jgi:hypothetical protein
VPPLARATLAVDEPRALFWDPDGEAHGVDQSSDEVSVNRSPRGGVVFGDCTAGIIRHEEFITY